VFALELILADSMGGIVFKDINQTMLIPKPMPHNFMNKPVPERVSRA
jgi:hypothetical protein